VGGAIRERWRAQRQADATKRTVYVADICSSVRAPLTAQPATKGSRRFACIDEGDDGVTHADPLCGRWGWWRR
jgi:hypothetical protein